MTSIDMFMQILKKFLIIILSKEVLTKEQSWALQKVLCCELNGKFKPQALNHAYIRTMINFVKVYFIQLKFIEEVWKPLCDISMERRKNVLHESKKQIRSILEEIQLVIINFQN